MPVESAIAHDDPQMLLRPFAAARPLSHLLRKPRHTPTLTQIRTLTQEDIDDPGMVSKLNFPISFTTSLPCLFTPYQYPKLTPSPNQQNGGYPNPPPLKRQFRDPYGDWWDKQERRNFGETVHEDHDILGMMSPYEYTHFTVRKGFFLMSCFVATVLGLCGVVRVYYPDRPATERTFPGGLDRELGGPGALLAQSDEEVQ
ncbi:MAG: hypothetical protein LQ338_005202 [Usnochroma carphineum]|nr:MAG: hypothetical protein LQ338_005202 [Usnochroma carphineum]